MSMKQGETGCQDGHRKVADKVKLLKKEARRKEEMVTGGDI